MFLVQVISEEIESMCELWTHLLDKNVTNLLLNIDHLYILLNGIKDFISYQDKGALNSSIISVKKNFDLVGLSQIQLAFLALPEAINPILRNRNIKPHWMFALDTIISSAVQVAISTLSPELDENILGHDLNQFTNHPHNQNHHLQIDPESISGIHSQTPTVRLDDLENDRENQLKRKYEKIKEENITLWQKLIATESQLKYVLTDRLREQQHQLDTLLSSQTFNYSEPHQSVQSFAEERIQIDQQLEKWLKDHQIDEIEKVCFLNCHMFSLIIHAHFLPNNRLLIKITLFEKYWKT